jgi:hypothetical protein
MLERSFHDISTHPPLGGDLFGQPDDEFNQRMERAANITVNPRTRHVQHYDEVMTSTPKKSVKKAMFGYPSPDDDHEAVTPPPPNRPSFNKTPNHHLPVPSTSKKYGMRDTPTMVQSSPIRPKIKRTPLGMSKAANTKPESSDMEQDQDSEDVVFNQATRILYQRVQNELDDYDFEKFARCITLFNDGKMTERETVSAFDEIIDNRSLFNDLKRMIYKSSNHLYNLTEEVSMQLE